MLFQTFRSVLIFIGNKRAVRCRVAGKQQILAPRDMAHGKRADNAPVFAVPDVPAHEKVPLPHGQPR